MDIVLYITTYSLEKNKASVRKMNDIDVFDLGECAGLPAVDAFVTSTSPEHNQIWITVHDLIHSTQWKAVLQKSFISSKLIPIGEKIWQEWNTDVFPAPEWGKVKIYSYVTTSTSAIFLAVSIG